MTGSPVTTVNAVARVLVTGMSGTGNDPGQQAEIAGYVETVEPLLRRGATLELDGRLATSELADPIEELIVPA